MAEPNELPYMTADEFLAGAQALSVVDDVFDELEACDCQAILDAAQIRRQQDWGELAGQIVGAENVPTD